MNTLRVATLLFFVGACSFTKRVDRTRITSTDASVDADGADGSTCAETIERACTDRRDDDCDGLIDCDDLDCSSNLSCCESNQGRPLAVGAWQHSLPVGVQPALVTGTTGLDVSTFISSFLSNDIPRALRLDACVPLELGVTFNATFRSLGTNPQCSPGRSCVHYAALVFTAAEGMLAGQNLPDDLAIRYELRDDTGAFRARLRITRGGETLRGADNLELISQDFGSQQVNIVLNFTPGVDDAGNAGIFASLTATAGTTMVWTPLTRRFVVRRTQMRDCTVGGLSGKGLHVAAEGLGDRMSVGALDVRFNECPNPANLSPNGVPLRAPQALGGQATWANAAWVAPSLTIYSSASRNAEVTELIGAGTNVDPQSVAFTNVNYALAGTQLFSDTSSWMGRRAGNPLLGNAPPTCVGGTGQECVSPIDNTEASILAPTLGVLSNGTSLFAAYRQHVEGQPDALRSARLSQSTGEPLSENQDIFSARSLLSDCEELRQPALFPRRTPDGIGGFYLLFVCHPAAGSPSMRAALLDANVSNARLVNVTVPTADWMRAGVVDLSVVTWFGSGAAPVPTSYKMWLVAEGDRGRSVGFFEAPYASESEALVFRPYSANPVLTDRDAALGACGASCSVDGIGVARSVSLPREVRIYLGVHGQTGGQTQYSLLPFLQRFASSRSN